MNKDLIKQPIGKILVADDQQFTLDIIVDLLSSKGYEMLSTLSANEILNLAIENQPDLILLDIRMGEQNGFEICQLIKDNSQTNLIPVMLMTVENDQKYQKKALNIGDDFLYKPFEHLIFFKKVDYLVQQKRLKEGLNEIQQVLFLVALESENRCSKNNISCLNLARLVKDFGEYLELSINEIEDLTHGAYLHDIGSIGVPEHIFTKTEELTLEEKEIMKRHVLIGEKLCKPLANRSNVLSIIRHHHEKWDGSGYPDGLVGNQIPFLVQIFQLCDIYNALISERPYKSSCNPSEALNILNKEMNQGLRNPELIDKFTEFIKSSNHS